MGIVLKRGASTATETKARSMMDDECRSKRERPEFRHEDKAPEPKKPPRPDPRCVEVFDRSDDLINKFIKAKEITNNRSLPTDVRVNAIEKALVDVFLFIQEVKKEGEQPGKPTVDELWTYVRDQIFADKTPILKLQDSAAKSHARMQLANKK